MSKRQPRNRERKKEGANVSRGKAIQNKPFALTGGFPDRSRVRLKYVEKVLIGNIGQSQVWSGNGLFDPNVTGTGSQPYNFDDWAVQYNRYRCYGSTLKTWCVGFSATYPTTQFSFMIGPRHTTTSVISTQAVLNDAWAAPYMTIRSESQLNAGYTPLNNSCKKSMTTAKFLGLSQTEQMSDQYQALTTSQPAHQWYWHTSILAADAASNITAYLYVELTYDVEFFDRVELTLDEAIERAKMLKLNRADMLRKRETVEVTEKKTVSPSLSDEDSGFSLISNSELKKLSMVSQMTPMFAKDKPQPKT